MKILKLSPQRWIDLIESKRLMHPFLRPEWISLTSKYFAKDCVLSSFEFEGRDVLSPIFINKDGTFSLASVGYGGPIFDHSDFSHSEAVRYVLRLVKSIEENFSRSFSSLATLPADIWTSGVEYGCIERFTSVIKLKESVDDTFRIALTGNVRTAIRKAERSNLDIRLLYQHEIATAHNLVAKTQIQVGASYITDIEFFNSLYNLNNPKCRMYGAFCEGRLVATIVVVAAGVEAFHLLHGWDRNLLHLNANQALIWRAIMDSIHDGIQWFNLGSSHTKSLAAAKQRWGAAQSSYLSLRAGDDLLVVGQGG